MRITMTGEEKIEWLKRMLKIKIECLDSFENTEEAYKQAYELAVLLEKECALDTTYKSFFADIKSYIYERIGYYKVKKAVMENTGYESNEIALTVKDLIRMNGKAHVLVGPLVYDESIPEKCLFQLEMICSDADFTKLKDARLIKNIDVILGNVILCDLNLPIELFFTGGVADLTRVSDFNMLPYYNFAANDVLISSISEDLNLKKVNGTIKIFSYDIDLDITKKEIFKNKNKIIYYPNVSMYEQEREKIPSSYMVKRKELK